MTSGEISELELKLRRKFYSDTDKHLKMQLELSQSTYLLKRIAGWTTFPLHDTLLRQEVGRFLESWDHKMTERAQGELGIDTVSRDVLE